MCSLPEGMLLEFCSLYSLENGWNGISQTKGVSKCYLCGNIVSDRILLDLKSKNRKITIGNTCKNGFSCSGFLEELIENREKNNEKMKKGWILLG